MNNMKATLQSDAVVGLHILNNSIYGGRNISIEVPVSYLVRARTAEEVLTNAILISNVRHSAMTALLESKPGQPPPGHSFAYFELSSYQSKDGTNLSTYDNTLSQILEAAVTININDGDVGVVLHIFCAFTSNYHSSYSTSSTRNTRISAAAAGDREKKRLGINLRSWAANKRQYIAFNPVSARSNTTTRGGNKIHLIQHLKQWRTQVVSLIVPEDRDEKEFIREKADAVIKYTETTLDFLVEGAIKSSETFCHLTAPYNHQPFSEYQVVSRTDLSKETRDEEEGVEIIFEPNDNTTPSEWKIIFELEDSESDSIEADSMVKQSGDVIIDLLDNVQLSSSNESDTAGTLVSDTDISYDMVKRHQSEGDLSYDSSCGRLSVEDDDTSWTILDDDKEFC